MSKNYLIKNIKLLKRIGLLVGTVCLLANFSSTAATYYVATTGNNSNAGTKDNPFASLQKGHDVAVAGDTVWIRGGTYVISGKGASANAGILLTKSGTSDSKRIYFWAYPGEKPKFDFSGLSYASSTTAGIYIKGGNWLHLKGLEVFGLKAPSTASNDGIWGNPTSNTIIELCDAHNIQGPGICIANGTGGNLILNCDSHDNYDPNSSKGAGQNADGYGCHYQTTGTSTIFRGCRAWWNSDDGYDFISQEFPVIVENCWAMGHGYYNSGTTKASSGNGNGFKAGSSKTGIRHIIKNCVAWKNSAGGFYANHSAGGNTWYNNTSYNNGTQYDMLASSWDASDNRTDGVTLTGTKVHIMRNNIGFPNDNTNMNGVDTKSNSWDLSITPVASDFMSVSDEGFMAARKPDGSLPDIQFMKLSAGSKFIDKGVDVGLKFAGTAPDLGAYETGMPTAILNPTFFQKAKLTGFTPLNQNLQMFDVTGRRLLPSSGFGQSIQPVIYRALQPDGTMKAISIVKMQ